MLKLSYLRVKDIQGIEDAEFDLSGKFVLIKGKNGVGKSTVMRQLRMYLSMSGKMDIPAPIRRGFEEGSSKLVMVDDNGREISLLYTVKQGKARKSHSLTAKIGKAKVSPEVITEMYGEAPSVFDMSGFISNQSTAAGRKKNVEMFFKKVLDLDLSGMDQKIQEKQEVLKEARATVKSHKPIVNQFGMSAEEIVELANREYTPTDTSELEEIHQDGLEHNQKIVVMRSDLKQDEKNRDILLTSIESKKGEIARLELALEDAQKDLQSMENHDLPILSNAIIEQSKAIDEFKEVDLSDIVEKIQNAKKNDEQRKNLDRILPTAKELAEAEGIVQAESVEEKRLLLEKQQALADAVSQIDMPDFMSWEMSEKDGTVKLMYKDESTGDESVPFVPGQVRQSAFVLGSAALAVLVQKGSPLPVVVVEDASLLDSENMAWLRSYCEENEFQLLAEIVSDSEEIVIEAHE